MDKRTTRSAANKSKSSAPSTKNGGSRRGAPPDKPPMSRHKKVLLSILGILCAIIIALIALVFAYLSQFQDTDPTTTVNPDAVNVTDQPEDVEGLEEVGDDDIPQATPSVSTIKEDESLITFIVFGLDNDDEDNDSQTRSDVMMIVTMDTEKKEIRLASLMRDTLVTMPEGQINRLNTAYVFGGPKYALQTINSVYALNLENYVTINFDSAAEIIDALGGVKIDVESIVGSYMSPAMSGGVHTLTGAQAVEYVRVRKISGGDFGRTARQRKVMMAIIKGLADASLDDAVRLASVLPQYVKTNFSSTEILSLANTAYSMRGADIKQLQVPQPDTYKMINYKNMSVLRVDFDANATVLHQFILGEIDGDEIKEDTTE